MKSPIRWIGGKFYLVPHLLKLIPKHHCYVEVFGGGAQLLFGKPPSKVEIYNDIDQNLVNFYRVLRDPEKYKKLVFLLELTPYSRLEWKTALQKLRNREGDDIERAYCFYYLIITCFNAFLTDKEAGGFSYSNSKNLPLTYFSKLPNFPQFHTRIKNVIVENLDYREILKKYDSPETFFYLDPPYLITTRSRNQLYTHELNTPEEHQELCENILKLQGKVLLSGYDNEIYNSYLKNWNTQEYETKIWCQFKPKLKNIIEKVWFNYPEPIPNLFQNTTKKQEEKDENGKLPQL